jgi:hypothetical protein
VALQADGGRTRCGDCEDPPTSNTECGVSSLEFSREKPGLLLANYKEDDVYLFHTHGLPPPPVPADDADAAGSASSGEADTPTDADAAANSDSDHGRIPTLTSAEFRRVAQVLPPRVLERIFGAHRTPAAAESTEDEGCTPCASTVLRGRRNVETFAKDATFILGDEWVATGGDCGNLFVWNVDTGVSFLTQSSLT